VQSGATVYPYTLDAASNRLLNVAGAVVKTYSYDAAGNTLSDGTLDFTWNAAGRMVKAATRSSIADNLYNGHGERVVKIGSRKNHGGPYLYFYDTTGQLIGDYEKARGGKPTANWVQQQETVWLGDIPVAVIKQPVATEPAQVYFIHADHLNTPRVIVDQTNASVWRWNNQNAFGNNPPIEDPDNNRRPFEYNLRFAGQYFDTETNLHYNYFRDYDPVTGRYLSSDPIGLAEHVQKWSALITAQHQTQFRYQFITLGDITDLTLVSSTPLPLELNPYNYVTSNPLRWTDLTGESIDSLGSFGGSAITSGLQCNDNDRKKKNCAALRDNIINQTCKSISNGKARMACFAAAWATYLACLAED